MAGVLNDYNQLDGNPRVHIGNWIEERALMQVAGQSRGASKPTKNDTMTRITGARTQPTDYSTTTETSLQTTIHAPHGPAFIASIAPPRRTARRDDARMEEAKAILEAQAQKEEQRIDAELYAASFGASTQHNRKRAIENPKKTLEECKTNNPLNGQAISFHTHHHGKILGTTPDTGVHTFSKCTQFSKPIEERF